MADLVVDSGVAIKWFLPEPYSTEARRILNDYQTGALSFLAPDLMNAELGSMALSIRQNCKFVTADERLANAIGSLFPNLIGVGKWV